MSHFFVRALVVVVVNPKVPANTLPKFILAPGCTVPSFSPKRSLRFLRECAWRA